MKLREAITNTSLAYLTPMLGHTYTQFVVYIRGCFIGDTSRPDLDNNILLLCDYESTDEYFKFEDFLTKHKHFKERYDPDNYSVMFVFNVPKEYEQEYHFLKSGEYSKFSDEYKRKIVKFWNLLSNHKYFKVLYKDPTRKEELEDELGTTLPENAELLSALDYDLEMYSDKLKVINPLAIITNGEPTRDRRTSKKK